MAEGKRKSNGKDKGRRRYRSDGTPIWTQPSISGPGVWVSCVKGKEKQTVGELYELFENIASELWPDDSLKAAQGEDGSDDSEEEDDGDIEKQIAKEVASMKRPRKEQRFANCQINTPCGAKSVHVAVIECTQVLQPVVFISCKPPVDPVQLVVKHVQNIAETGVTHTRYTQRLTPVSGTCVANIPEIQSLCKRVITPFFESDPERSYRYKIELRMRNHNTLARPVLIQELAKCIPEQHAVDLDNAEVFVLVEVFKSVCGLSVVKDYYKLQKFNVMEIANSTNAKVDECGRVTEKSEGTTSHP
ncbi:hypothetical protein WOLCODRAFT_102214 [Wolfiporia cocos MD-104 SS10]|uniref:THUMP domain-containing protein n=1 Tax=Wolfiporia cocos (strain MD-104) TaxID=742152 RepID=A0A2H3JJW0_WOLCO|nr:hypothetical protein WOLCODRAFT_102214 [Wolfiporia cocos MD-104 SS10]